MATVKHTYKYQCTECGQPERICVKASTPAPVKRVREHSFDSKLCISCYCNHHIAEAAENVAVFL